MHNLSVLARLMQKRGFNVLLTNGTAEMSLPVSLVCEAGFAASGFGSAALKCRSCKKGRYARAHEQVNTGARDHTFTSGFIRTTIGDEGLMATEIKCTCGAIWERTEVQTEARDSDDLAAARWRR